MIRSLGKNNPVIPSVAMLMKAVGVKAKFADHYILLKNLLATSRLKSGLVIITKYRYLTYLNKTLDCPRYLFGGARPRKPAKQAKLVYRENKERILSEEIFSPHLLQVYR